jgi:hypothetical protein
MTLGHQHDPGPTRAGSIAMDDRANSTGTPAAGLTKRTGRICRFCNIGLLRRSRMRPTDLPWLLVLRWPVRCLRCSKRQYLLWHRAMQVLSSHTPHAPELLARQSWQNYTGDHVTHLDRRDEDLH